MADFQTDSLTPIPLATRSPGTPIPVGGNPTDIAGWPSSRLVYVSGGDTVTPVDVPTGRPGAPIPLGTTAEALALSGGGQEAWVCGGNGDLVHVDLTARTVLGHIAVGGQPIAVAIAGQMTASG